MGRATYQRSCRESGQGLICCESQRCTGGHNEKKLEWVRDDGNGLPAVLDVCNRTVGTCFGRLGMSKKLVLGTLVIGFEYAAIASITIAMIMTVHNTAVRFICFMLSLFFL